MTRNSRAVTIREQIDEVHSEFDRMRRSFDHFDEPNPPRWKIVWASNQTNRAKRACGIPTEPIHFDPETDGVQP